MVTKSNSKSKFLLIDGLFQQKFTNFLQKFTFFFGNSSLSQHFQQIKN